MALTSASVGLGFDLGRCRFPERGRLGAAAPLAVRADSGRLRLPAAEAGPAVARAEAGRLRLRPLAGIGESYGHPRRELAVTRGWLRGGRPSKCKRSAAARSSAKGANRQNRSLKIMRSL